MLTALEIKAAQAAVVTAVLVLTVTFVTGNIYWQHAGRLEKAKPLAGPMRSLPRDGLFL
jgi:hypothetical protein